MARIRGPVGLNIEAVTAPEIALSIIAEIVAVRRGAPRAGRRRVARGMKFGAVPLDEARGAIMAHSQRVGDSDDPQGRRCWTTRRSPRCAKPAAPR